MIPKITTAWIIDNLLGELLFGIILIGLVALLWGYIKDAWNAVRIYRIISTHNNPTRTWRKGVYARDRFMMIYEAGRPLSSQQIPVWGPSETGGVWWEQYIDEGILEYHGLVALKHTQNGLQVEVSKSRLARWVYLLSRWFESREASHTHRFTSDKSGKLRKITKP